MISIIHTNAQALIYTLIIYLNDKQLVLEGEIMCWGENLGHMVLAKIYARKNVKIKEITWKITTQYYSLAQV